jgi:competence protein ComEC
MVPKKNTGRTPTGVFLFALVVGILLLHCAAELPARPLALAAFGAGGAGFLLVVCGLRIPSRLIFLLALSGGLACGWGYAALRAEARLAEDLPPEWEGRDLRLVGRIASLPVEFAGGQRFVFETETVDALALKPGTSLPRRLWLSHYFPARREGHAPLRFRAGERWALTARLKRPHGTVNPGGFDYEAWLFTRNLRATGSLRTAPAPIRLAGFQLADAPAAPLAAIHHLRARVREIFRQQLGDAPYGGILTALAIGDQESVTSAQWALFNRTGTTHLMSISGLHVTLFALLLMALTRWLWRCFPRLCRWLPAPRARLCVGAAGALAYALFAGFGVPARRTALMVCLAALVLMLGRKIGAGRLLLLTLAGVTLADPFAPLAPGFWLSFGAVAALIWLGTRSAMPPEEDVPLPPGRWIRRLRQFLTAFGVTQWAAMLATLPILLWVFQQFPLASPLANLIAIPVIGFVVTPLALLAAALALVAPPLASLPLTLANGFMNGLMRILEILAALPLWQPPAADFFAVPLAAAGVFLLLLPRGVAGKFCAVLLLLPLIFWPLPRLAPGTLRVTVLDVGQGQAVLLETAQHRLLYDAGPRYGFGKAADDAARRALLPYFARRGITALDALILSHRDSDHAGGFATLNASLALRRIFSPIPELFGGKPCQRGEAWVWDAVRFEFLHPAPSAIPLKGDNGDSCVLKITTGNGRMLLAGDIDRRTERALLNTYAANRTALAAEVLLLPHHGSKSSSSLAFAAAVAPEWALASVGYRNRFGHPHPEVLERYRLLGTQNFHRTDRDGALLLDFTQDEIRLVSTRATERRYWRMR